MPITKSAKKALKQSINRRSRNLRKKNTYKSALKEFRKLAAGENKEEATKLLPKVYKTLDKAAKTNVIHKNKASRLKSSVTKLISPQKTA